MDQRNATASPGSEERGGRASVAPRCVCRTTRGHVACGRRRRSLILNSAVLAATLSLAPASDAIEKIGRAKITFYWMVDEASPVFEGSRRATVRDVKGKVLARTSAKFRRQLLLEGSGRLRDGRVVTYQRHVNGEARFRITRHEFGAGIGSCPLVPYRTIAVDPKFIALGTKVYIPELKGIELPDGTIHDGVFTAHDKSAYVKGAHIDIFTRSGRRATWPFIRDGITSGKKVTIYRLSRPERSGCHRR